MRTALIAALLTVAACTDPPPPAGSYVATWTCENACANPDGLPGSVTVTGDIVSWFYAGPPAGSRTDTGDVAGYCVDVLDEDTAFAGDYSLCSDNDDEAHVTVRTGVGGSCTCHAVLSR